MPRLLSQFSLGLLLPILCGLASVAAAEGHPAINAPDEFAWKVFVAINKPSDENHPDGAVVWETWALASDVFGDPQHAPAWSGESPGPRSLESLEARPLQQVILDMQQQGMTKQSPAEFRSQFRVDPNQLQRHGNETRMNRDTFDFIVDNELYFVEGQEAFFDSDKKVEFPIPSREIKAQWRRLDDTSQHARYHTAKIVHNGNEEVWGLTALHITTKDLPNWFWATFEHTDNLGREAVVPSRDAFGLAADGGPSEKLKRLLQEQGLAAKWENYILRGTQTDFVDPVGRPTLLANSQVERGFQSTSSCITCHARSSVGPKPEQSFNVNNPQGPNDTNRLTVFESTDPVLDSIGTPNPAWFIDTSTTPSARKFTQLDFVWSLFRAQRRQPFPQPSTPVIQPLPQGDRAHASADQRANGVPCCGQSTEKGRQALMQPTGQGSGSAAEGRLSGLAALERSAAQRSVPPNMTVPQEEYSEMIKAANAFASSLAGDDDVKYTHLATSAISQALLTRQGLPPAAAMAPLANSARETEAARVAERSHRLVWETPLLNANFRDLMEQASQNESGLFPITGPPLVARVVGPGTQIVGDQRFRDCVAVGVRINGQDRYCCTGTLISPRVVVTAGHCFFCVGGGATNAVVYVGADINSPGQAFTGTAHRHPQYNTDGTNNDLAVIVLDSPIAGATPRRIATSDEINGTTFVRVVGFGNSDHDSTGGFGTKRMVDVPIASHSCNGVGHSVLGCDAGLELIAGFVGLGPDSCNGDSGGPIYVLVGGDARDDNAWAVAGATSRATDLATRLCGDGGVYARLDQYLEFIQGFVDSTENERTEQPGEQNDEDGNERQTSGGKPTGEQP